MQLRGYKESEFTYRGFPCVVLFVSECYRCGYVGLPKGHPMYGKHYDDIDVSCHGGLTYARDGLWGQERPDTWWIGFDCHHFGDFRDYESARRYFGDDPEVVRHLDELWNLDCNRSFYRPEEIRYGDGDFAIRDLAYVEAQCRYIIDQLV